MKPQTLISFLSAFGMLLSVPLTSAFGDSMETFSHTTTSGDTPVSDTYTLPTFDTSLGTLEAIDLSLEENTTADIVIYNSTSASKSFTDADAAVKVIVSGPDSVALTITNVASAAGGTVAPGLNDFPGIQSSSSDSTQIDPSDFTFWEGTTGQTLQLSFTSDNGTFSGGSAPGVFFGGSALVGGSTTVKYTYIPTGQVVPEPSTWGLMLGGLSLLIYRRLRRRRV